eukprot:5754312-Pleurochrysis_carterae.AAC.1
MTLTALSSAVVRPPRKKCLDSSEELSLQTHPQTIGARQTSTFWRKVGPCPTGPSLQAGPWAECPRR